MISFDAVTVGEPGNDIEPAASLIQHGWVMLANGRAGRRSAIGDGEAYGHPGPGQLGREEAAATAGGMADRVRRQLGRAESYVVMVGVASEKLCDEPSDVAHLVFPAGKDPAPPHGAP